MKTNKTTLTPLTPAVFCILLALASGEKHGYEIMGSGTLYGSIKRMLADQLIEEAGERSEPTHEDERRRYYRLTALGRPSTPSLSHSSAHNRRTCLLLRAR
ncbi:MAG TPA: PadR family transcriptional regulator [Ktedonobacteraceae bacterium]